MMGLGVGVGRDSFSVDYKVNVDPICFKCPYPECLYPSCRSENKRRSEHKFRVNENNLKALEYIRNGDSVHSAAKKLGIAHSGLYKSLKSRAWNKTLEEAIKEGAARRKRPKKRK